jgi:hypothetical protein
MQFEIEGFRGLCAIAGSDSKVQDGAEELNIPKTYESYEALLMIKNRCCLYSFTQ